MDCSFKQEKKFIKYVNFKDMNGRKIEIYLDWSSYQNNEQKLIISVYDEEKALKDDSDSEMFDTEFIIARDSKAYVP